MQSFMMMYAMQSERTNITVHEEEKATLSKDEINLEMGKRKAKMLANMKFIGNLFLRQLLAVKVIGQVVHDLIGIKDGAGYPEEHMIECVCELLEAIGYTLDQNPHGKMLMLNFICRLNELKMQKHMGKSVYPKRVQFLIQDLQDLRNNNWQKKLFKEQAKTKDEVRKDAAKDAKSKGTEAMFSTTVAGVRPSYMEDLKINKNTTRATKPEPPAKPEWNQAYVKRAFQYFAEEKSAQDLQDTWLKAQPTLKQSKEGVEWIAEIGFNDSQKEDSAAKTLVELLQRQVFNWNTLGEAFQANIEGLEDMKIDVPHCDIFFHSLLSRLILAVDRSFQFNPILLKQVCTAHENSHSDFHWKLIAGALKRVRQNGGQDAYKRALDLPSMTESLAKVKGCSKSDVARLLQEEIGRDH
jgi:hypothetical protein